MNDQPISTQSAAVAWLNGQREVRFSSSSSFHHVRTGASIPNSVALIVGRFWLYAICRRSSKVLEQTMLPSAEVNAIPPQLQAKRDSIRCIALISMT